MCKNATQWHPRHNVCAGVSGVTKDAGPASCAVVASQWAGGAVREGEVLFSVFFLGHSWSWFYYALNYVLDIGKAEGDLTFFVKLHIYFYFCPSILPNFHQNGSRTSSHMHAVEPPVEKIRQSNAHDRAASLFFF